MGLFSMARASTSADRLEQIIRSFYGGRDTSSGESITHDRALTISTVYSCFQVLSQSVAQTPIHMFERNKSGSTGRVFSHPLEKVVCDQPNDWMTDYDLKALVMINTCLRGNSVWFPTRLGSDLTIRELIPVHPDLIVAAKQDEKYRIFVDIKRPNTSIVDSIPYDKLFHYKGLTTNGFWGVDPITYAREMLGLAVATEKYGAKFFSKGAKMGGILSVDKPLSEKATNNLLNSFNEKIADIENSHRTILLEQGTKWIPTTMLSDNAQFLETRRHQRSEIAGWFRVPAHFINDLEKATFSNIEHLDLSLVKHVLSPYYVSIEKTFRRALMTEEEKRRFFFKFNADGLVRGDIKSRYEAYYKAVGGPWMTADEVRELDNRDKIKGGDVLLQPLNMLPEGKQNEPAPVT